LELEILTWVQDHAPVTVRDAAEHFARERELARTTVTTILERLRKKGYLERRLAGSVNEYLPAAPKAEVQSALIGEFVRNVLGGSLSPFMAYLTRKDRISDAELEELKRLVRELEEHREGEGS
jgi:predicted transcriptional regulator